MNNEQRVILLVTSRLLNYPDHGLKEFLGNIEDFVQQTIVSSTVKEEIRMMYKPFESFHDIELQELYVETFDLKTKLGLYLTAHELGDSNRRGAALIKLQKMINQAGFERVGEELADYIPMLLEFLTVAPKSSEIERLKKRLGVTLSHMKGNLAENNPYFGVFALLMKYVFSQPTKEELQQLEMGREEADLEELPYPIMYQ